MYYWTKFKQAKGGSFTERIRLKFYRAMNICKKMKSHTQEYMMGYFDGAGLDEETRSFIEFIHRRWLSKIPEV